MRLDKLRGCKELGHSSKRSISKRRYAACTLGGLIESKERFRRKGGGTPSRTRSIEQDPVEKNQLLKGEDDADELRRNMEFSDDWICEVFGAGLGLYTSHAWIPVNGNCAACRVYRDWLRK